MERRYLLAGLLATTVLLMIWSVTAATYYMTVSSVVVTTSNPHSKDIYSLTLSVTYASPSGVSATDCKARVSSLPTGWRVKDDYTGSTYKTLSSCSGTTTFDIMPVTIGTINARNIVVEVSGTDSSGQNTISPGTGSPSGTIEVKYQPVLGLTLNTSTNSTEQDTLFLTEYRVVNSGSASYTADTSNLRLVISSNPSGAATFEDDSTSMDVGIGVLAASGTSTGTVNLKFTSSASNGTNNITITATADNTQYESSESQLIQCTNCVGEAAVQTTVNLKAGWNLISLPNQPSVGKTSAKALTTVVPKKKVARVISLKDYFRAILEGKSLPSFI